MAEAQDGNQISSATAQEAQQKLSALAQRIKELVASAGINISLAQGDNLADQLRTLNESSQLEFNTTAFTGNFQVGPQWYRYPQSEARIQC